MKAHVTATAKKVVEHVFYNRINKTKGFSQPKETKLATYINNNHFIFFFNLLNVAYVPSLIKPTHTLGL